MSALGELAGHEIASADLALDPPAAPGAPPAPPGTPLFPPGVPGGRWGAAVLLTRLPPAHERVIRPEEWREAVR